MAQYDKFWQEVKRVRKERKVKQQDIADLLNISQVAYSDLENGKTELSMERMMSIVQFLEIENPLVPVKDEMEGRLDEVLPTLIQKSPLMKEFFDLQAKQLEQNIDIQKQQLALLKKMSGED